MINKLNAFLFGTTTAKVVVGTLAVYGIVRIVPPVINIATKAANSVGKMFTKQPKPVANEN
jgi:hypothetical protein